MRWIDIDYQLYTLHRQFQFFRQYLFWTVSDRLFLLKLLLYLLYQFSEHIIVHITLIIILVVSLLPLSRNETNSHFLNNWQSWDNQTSQADRIWSEGLIWPWKATIWIRFIKKEIGISQNEKAMWATSEGENEVNILTSLCYRKWEKTTEKTEQKRTAKRINWHISIDRDQILKSVLVFIITIPLVTATAYYHCTCSVHFIHTMRFQLYVRILKIFFIF